MMSGIFGIFNRDDKLVDEQIVQTILDVMSNCEPDEKGIFIDGPVALGHTMLWNTPESKYEHLPLENDTFVLTMDARIDNRVELLEQLELPDKPLSEIGDSEFILSAYKKWGEECPKYLLGDFAFAIWDNKMQQLFCARDHVGIKPFYYYSDDEKFVFSNHIQGIISHSEVTNIISDKSIAVYLKNEQLIDSELTFFESIVQLPAASILIVSQKNVQIHTYWQIENSPSIHFDSLEEYSNRLRELLEDSILVRTRSAYPVASHLSGGLDSSVISILASRNLNSEGKKLYAYNWIPYPENGEDETYYEWGNSKKIAEKNNMEHISLTMGETDILKIYETHNISLNDTIGFWYEHLVQKSAKEMNARVILSGWGGDEFISYDSQGYVSGLFWKGNVLAACKIIFSEIHSSNRKFITFVKKLYRMVFLPIIPHWIYCRLSNSFCGITDEFKYLTSDALKRIKMAKLQTRKIKRIGTKEEQLSLFHYGHLQARINSWNASGYCSHIEYRYPLLDKRIIEFAMGIPENLYRQGGHGRFLFRYTVQDILEEDICWFNTKPEPSRINNHYKLLYKAQNLWMKEILENSLIDHEYVNIKLLLKDIEDLEISNTILTEKEIDKLSMIECVILLLGIKV